MSNKKGPRWSLWHWLKLTLTKINITWQLLVEVSKSQQDWSPRCWLDNTNCNQWSWNPAWPWPIGSLCAHGSTTLLGTCDLSSLGWKVSPQGSLPRSAGNAEAQRCAQAEVESGSTSCSQPHQPLGMLSKELLWVGTWCPLSGLAICALFTASSPAATEVAVPHS